MNLKAYAATTHQGPFLGVNEDGYDFDLDLQLFTIFDGLGGSGIGDRAIGKLKEDLKSFLRRLSRDPEATMPLYWNPRWLLEANALINAMLNAHQVLYRENSPKDLNQRAAASAICAIKADDVLCVAQVGGCMAYLARRGRVEPLFIPDNLMFLSPEVHGPQALLTPATAFGFYPELGWNMREVRVQPGDQLVLLTEGIYPWVESSELGHVLMRGDDLHRKLNDLLKLSNDRGNSFNQTGMILEF